MLRSVHKTLAAGTNYLSHQVGNEELYLLGANLEVQDSLGNPTRNAAGNIWLQAINEANAISLSVGNLRNGCIQGFGCLPLMRGYEIQAAVYHATADEIAKLNLILVTPDDAKAKGMNLVPSWQPSISALPVYPNGKPKLVTTTGAATVTTVSLRPADGYIYEVIEAWAYHDDGADRKFTWNYYDGTTTINQEQTATISSSHRIHLGFEPTGYLGQKTLRPPVLTYDCYLRCTLDALAAGKTLTVGGYVLEYSE